MTGPRRVPAALRPLLLTPAARLRRLRGGPSPLAGRRVLITGASSGIGRATALGAAAVGARVVLVARRGGQLEEVAAAVRAAGGEATARPCDLTDLDAVDELVAAVLADGPVDVLVNNAGRSIRRSLALSHDRFHDFERTMAINYFAAVRLTMGLLPAMRAQGDGHVVNVLTWGVQLQGPKFAAYIASKSALGAFGRVLAREEWCNGITCTNMRFGLVDTDMVVRSGEYGPLRGLTPAQAGRKVVRAMEDRPVATGTVAGAIGELGAIAFPRLADAGFAWLHRRLPDTAEARRGAGDGAATAEAAAGR